MIKRTLASIAVIAAILSASSCKQAVRTDQSSQETVSATEEAPSQTYNGKTLGVLGGMGPAASAEFMRLLAAKAPAVIDQQHPKVILYSIPGTPDRTAFILGKGEDPEPYLIDGLKTLSGWGADILAVTCNTAHYYIDHFRQDIDKPIVHIIEETIRESRDVSPEGAWLLATSGTMKAGIYQNHAEQSGYTFFVPGEDLQPSIHHMTDLVKAGKCEEAGQLCKDLCEKLWKEKDVPIVAGCTEIPIAYDYSGLPSQKCISSLEALVDGCLRELYD